MERLHHRGTGLRKRFQQALCATLAVTLALGSTPVPAQSSSALPGLGDGNALSPAAERRMGDSIVRYLYRDPDYLPDLVLMDYVESIWQPLLAAAR